jgi:hypothetical protein
LPAEWRYDREHNQLIVSRPVDDGQYLLRLYGAYQLPLCVALSDQAKADSFRVIVDGRIAEAERDYRVDQANGYVNLLACATGNEKFMIQYRTKNGACSVGSLSLGELTRPLLQYIGFPLEGNTRCADSEGRIFTALDNDVHDVWMVQLVPWPTGTPVVTCVPVSAGTQHCGRWCLTSRLM